MNNKLVKIFSILLMVIMLCSITLNVFAASKEPTTLTPSQITSENNIEGATGIATVGKKIVGVLQTVGIVLSVIILIVLGIKYMMGSAEEKADYKKSMMPYIVGAALIFSASAFAQVIYGFFSGWSV